MPVFSAGRNTSVLRAAWQGGGGRVAVGGEVEVVQVVQETRRVVVERVQARLRQARERRERERRERIVQERRAVAHAAAARRLERRSRSWQGEV